MATVLRQFDDEAAQPRMRSIGVDMTTDAEGPDHQHACAEPRIPRRSEFSEISAPRVGAVYLLGRLEPPQTGFFRAVCKNQW